MLSSIPLLVVPFILYNLGLAGVFGAGPGGDPWSIELFSFSMMSGGVFSMTLGMLMIVIALVTRTGPNTALKDEQAMWPDLTAQLNTVDTIEIRGDADQTVTLIRADGTWLVEQRDYPAKVGDIRELLISLSEATILEDKTSNPDLYARLGVQPHGEGDTANQLIRLQAGDTELGALILGNTASQPRGSYVRLSDAETSGLADRVLVASADISQWLEPVVINLAPDAIQTVQVRTGDGEAYVIAREADNGTLSLVDIPDGRTAKGANVARVPRVLQNLRLEDVLPADAELPTQGWTKLQFDTTAGERITVEVIEHDERKLMRIQVAATEDSTLTVPAQLDGRAFTVQGYKFNDATLGLDLLTEAIAP